MPLFDTLNQAIRDYQTLQEKQLSAMDTQVLPDIETLNFERAAAFADLKNGLDHFLNFSQSENTDELAIVYQGLLTDILATDKVIMEKISIHKERLKMHMHRTKKNQAAMSKYADSTRLNHLKTMCFTG